MDEFRRLSDREMEYLIELWRQEECLWKVTCKNYLDIDTKKTAMLNISKQMGRIDTSKGQIPLRYLVADRSEAGRGPVADLLARASSLLTS